MLRDRMPFPGTRGTGSGARNAKILTSPAAAGSLTCPPGQCQPPGGGRIRRGSMATRTSNGKNPGNDAWAKTLGTWTDLEQQLDAQGQALEMLP